MMAIPGGIFYNTGIQQQAAQSMFTNTLYGPFGVPLTSPPPYCQNCECDGCKIHREWLRLQQEKELERARVIFDAPSHPMFDVMAGEKMKPGSLVPLDVKPGIVTEEWWAKHRWKFYLFWSLGVAGVVHLFMTCATRQV